MNEAKHTVNDWSVLDHCGVYVIAGAGLTVATVLHQVMAGEQLANARLIAAAPELLAALQSIAADNEFCGDAWGDRRDAWIATARAAIKKATGEQA